MNDIDALHRRIRQRRTKEKPREHRLARLLYHIVMLVMGMCVLILALLLNQKLELVSLPAAVGDFRLQDLGSWLPFENWFSLQEEAVSATPSYALLKDNQYSNGSNMVYNLQHGVVLHVEKSKAKSSITIRQDNGVVVTYGNMVEVHLKKDERVLKDKVLGTYEGYLTIQPVKDHKNVSLHEALEV